MDNEANLGGSRRTKTTMLNQVGIDDGVKEKGVDAVIHVVIHVIAGIYNFGVSCLMGNVEPCNMSKRKNPKTFLRVSRKDVLRPSRSVFEMETVIFLTSLFQLSSRHSRPFRSR